MSKPTALDWLEHAENFLRQGEEFLKKAEAARRLAAFCDKQSRKAEEAGSE
ncbi:hypothetical protein ACUH93_00670 [Dermabacteraceae bacterium P7006]